MDISVNVIKQGGHMLVAACDLNLLGCTLKFGKINFEVHRNFYGGSVVSVEKAMTLIRRGNAANLIGPVIVNQAVEEGLIHPNAVLSISGIPHTQIVRM
jgi:hypothetical protein